MEFLKRRKKILGVVVTLVGVLVASDYYVGYRQDAILRAAQEKKDKLEQLAFFMIFPDIHDAWNTETNREEYEAVIKVDNVSDEVIYTTHPRVTTYVQTGTFWTEVPTRDLDQENVQQIYQLEPGQSLYRMIATIGREIPYTEYNMYGYMHVRFHISLYVLPESVFDEEEVLERYTDVYIYLKPFFISDADILAQVAFADDQVPEMIPMPPH